VEQFKTQEIIAILLKRKSTITIAVIIAAVVSFAASFLIKPKFKSRAVVYPVNISSVGEESTTEQLIEYFNSEEIKYRVADKLDLYKHYKLERNEPLVKTYLGFMYKENVSISPTLYESVNIEVLDTDPAMAQKIVSGIIQEVDTLIMRIKRVRLKEYIDNYKHQLALTQNVIDSLSKRSEYLNETYKLMDYKVQSKLIGKKIVKGEKLTPVQDSIYRGLLHYRPEVEEIYHQINTEFVIRENFKKELDKNTLDYNSKLSFCNIVSPASLPDKKATPVRWIIVAAGTLSVFALACIYFIYISRRKDAE
jgi:LPS O-antigen subunit length determinant protein (WzzB/FepE family)